MDLKSIFPPKCITDNKGDADSTTLVSLLQQCGKARALSEGKRVHAYIVKWGYAHDTYLANLLVQMYGRCGCPEEAYLVFTRMQERDAFSWNMMIQAYAQNGHLEDAKGLFDITPKPNVVSWTTMITAYGQNGYLEDARRMFEGMPRKNGVSWNAVITAYAQNGYTSDAIELFRRMLLEGTRPNKVSFISALAACAGCSAERVDVETMHANIVECGFQSDATVATALINLLGKRGKLEAAKSAFGEIAQRDVCSCTAMVAAYAQSGQVQLAKSLFDGMSQRDVAAWNAMITAYAQNGHMQEATSMFETMPQRNVVSWSTMVAANAHSGNNKDSIKLFCKMDLEGISPNKITFLGVFDACGDSGSLEQGKLIHADVVENGLEADISIATALVSMYGKCARLADTKAMFDKIPCSSNVVAWTALVTAYAQSGHWKEALNIFHSMVLEGVKPNEITFVSVLSACSRGGDFADAWHYFAFMKWDYDVRLTREHYVCMIDLLGRAGNLNEAEDLLHNMPFQPCVVSWISLLCACNKSYGSNERATHVAKQLADLDSCNSQPYVLLSNIHAQGTQ